MKRLMVMMLLVCAGSVIAAAQDQGMVMNPSDDKFAVFPNFPDCVKGAVLHGSPDSDQGVTVIAKATAGCKVPWHFHSANEQVGMVSGMGNMEVKGQPAKKMGAGSYAFMPAKQAHQFTCSTACTFFAAAEGKFDIHYVDANGSEIPFEQAVPKKGGAGKAAPKKK